MGLTAGQFWELVGDESPSQGSFAVDQTSITVVIDVQWDALQDTLVGLLGYSQKADGKLRRSLPTAHPRFPWLYATKITNVTYYQFDGQGSPLVAQPPTVNGGPALPLYARYNFVRLHVLFESLTYDVVADGYIDGQGGDESLRYVTTTAQPRAEALSIDRGLYQYTGTGSTGYVASTSDNPAAGIQIRVAKLDLSYTWHMVPQEVLGLPNGVPTKQLNLLGTTNAAAFRGYAAGTLLLSDIKMRAHNFGVEPDFAATQATRFYDVDLHCVFFNPGYANSGAGAALGHNSLPDKKGGWCAIQTVNGSKPLYPSGDWTQLFGVN